MATVKIRNMRTKNLKGNLKAFFTADLGTLSIEDMKLIEGTNGLFLGFPSRSYEVGGETKWSDLVRLTRDSNGKYTPAAQTLYDTILAAVLTEYEKSAGIPASTQSDEDDDGLPF